MAHGQLLIVQRISLKTDKIFHSQNAVPSTNFVIGLHEGHVSPIFDHVMGDRSQTKQEMELRRWLAQILKRDTRSRILPV